MASRLSHIVMLQCVNRHNYKRCTGTLLTSICADGRKRAEREEVFFFFQALEWMKRFWAGWKSKDWQWWDVKEDILRGILWVWMHVYGPEQKERKKGHLFLFYLYFISLRLVRLLTHHLLWQGVTHHLLSDFTIFLVLLIGGTHGNYSHRNFFFLLFPFSFVYTDSVMPVQHKKVRVPGFM